MENKEYNIEYKCPCCNKYTFYDLYDICPYCFWENDNGYDRGEDHPSAYGLYDSAYIG